MMKVTLKGKDAVLSSIKQIAQRFPIIVGAALYQEAQIEMTESKRRVPVEHGILKASGFVTFPENKGRNISVTLSYGGAAEAYAIVQHERLDFHHPLGGQAKYLESVLNESRPFMAARIAARMDFNRANL